MALIALPNGAIECILSFAQTPKDAVRLAAVSKRFLHLEQTVLYKRLTVRATNTAALAWMRARGNRIIGYVPRAPGSLRSTVRDALTLSNSVFSPIAGPLNATAPHCVRSRMRTRLRERLSCRRRPRPCAS